MSQTRITYFANLAVIFGLIFLAIGISEINLQRHSESSNSVNSAIGTISPTLPERELAINEARSKGSKTYTYTAHFTPGIGFLSQAQNLQQQISDSNK